MRRGKGGGSGLIFFQPCAALRPWEGSSRRAGETLKGSGRVFHGKRLEQI